jgi:enoyl reductase-like protein
MANQRQADVVNEARTIAARLDEAINDLEALNARYDQLNLESPNFATGFFGTTQEITANQLLGLFTSKTAVRNAATAQWDAWRAATRAGRY